MVFERLIINAKKPVGKMGRIMASEMNRGTHEKLAKWGMTHFDIRGDVLDIGCGGGGNIDRMLQIESVETVNGLDYSEVSVNKSKEVNKKAIAEGRCEIVQGNVVDIPYEKDSFDTVTAFETVYFWPNMDRSFEEVIRVMRPGASFAITNESNGTDKDSIKYSKIIEGMNLYTPQMLKDLLEKAGFVEIEVYEYDKKPWITIVGKKPNKS